MWHAQRYVVHVRWPPPSPVCSAAVHETCSRTLSWDTCAVLDEGTHGLQSHSHSPAGSRHIHACSTICVIAIHTQQVRSISCCKAEQGTRVLTEGSWVVVEVAQGTDGVLMLTELHKAQPPGAGQPICRVYALRIPQNLGLLHSRLRLGSMLLHLHTRTSLHLQPLPISQIQR